MAAYWEIAAHSANNVYFTDLVQVSNCLFFFFFFFFISRRFLEWEFLSDCAFSLSLPSCTFIVKSSIFIRLGSFFYWL